MKIYSIWHNLKDDIFFRRLLWKFYNFKVIKIFFRCGFTKLRRHLFAKFGAQMNDINFFSRYNFKNRSYILSLVNSINSLQIDEEFLNNLPKISSNIRRAHENFNETPIRLASVVVNVTGNLFEEKFQDPEDTMSLHRFLWLQFLFNERLDSEIVDFGLKKRITDWITIFSDPKDDIVFETYSICERLISWLFFIMLTGGNQRIPESLSYLMRKSIEKQLLWIVKHLEYHGSDTNNHILNNARALYICGSLLHIENVKELGKQICIAETDSMIVDGTLLEGSSHYQMLITRWYMEIYLIAWLINDQGFINWIEPRLAKMLVVCNKLQSKFSSDEFPLFGDISPDLPPSYFIGFPFSARSSRNSLWYRLLKNNDSLLFASYDAAVRKLHHASARFKNTNLWYYLEENGIEVWVIGYNGGNKRHGHNDNGSIVVFFRGRPVIVDLGLVNYRQGAIATNQASWQGHNIPLINGMPADIDKYSYLGDSQIYSSFELINKNDYCIEYSVKYAINGCKLIRKVELSESKLIVEDRVLSDKETILVETNWHFADIITLQNVEGSKDKFFFKSKMVVQFSTENGESYYEMVNSKRSMEYGHLLDIHTIVRTVQVRSDEPAFTTIDLSDVISYAA